tara:strand:+ start:2060 stop:2191 length:132 start_codon:yes stop_codon:yes gene_type:complete
MISKLDPPDLVLSAERSVSHLANAQPAALPVVAHQPPNLPRER